MAEVIPATVDGPMLDRWSSMGENEMAVNEAKAVALLEAVASIREAAFVLTGDLTINTLLNRVALRISMKTGVTDEPVTVPEQRN